MDTATLNRLTLGIFRGEVPLEVCKDAAQELSPPMRWSDWLESSGTLMRLAEAMVHFSLADGNSQRTFIFSHPEFVFWCHQTHIAAVQWDGDQELVYFLSMATWETLCSAFGIPAVMIEVGHRSLALHSTSRTTPEEELRQMRQQQSGVVILQSGETDIRPLVTWEPPSCQLALVTLKEAMRVVPAGLIEETPKFYYHGAASGLWFRESEIVAAVRSSHPAATAWRVRVENGDWQERQI